MTTTEEKIRRIAEIDAVQSNAGVGLTIGDVEDILTIVRGKWPYIASIADFIDPGWRITTSRSRQSQAIERAAAVREAVRAHDAKHAK
jgi:hypothetical protein